jgi:hypothetical protein
VSESTLEAPPVAESATPGQGLAPEPVPWTLRGFMREHPWWSVGVVLVLLSAILVVWARTRPSYDAYGWLVWGYQTLHLTLDLGGAPSWKPLPYLFTVPYAVFGHYQLWLWMLTATAVALAGPVFAGRIAFRLTDAGDPGQPDDSRAAQLDDSGAALLGEAGRRARGRPEGEAGSREPDGSRAAEFSEAGGRARGRREGTREREPIYRSAPWAAAVVAGAAVFGLEDYFHYILSAQSDPMLVTFVLAAIDMFLLGRYRWTLVLGVLAALGRPEVWPFLGVFMIWAYFKVPSMRWMLLAGGAVIVFMWFGIPTITNGRPNISGELAKLSPRALRHNRLFGTIGRFTELQYLPVWIAALGVVAWAAVRRLRAILLLAAGAVAWVVVEIAFAYHGWPALPRYMFEAAAVGAVLAGVAVGWVLRDPPRMRGGVPRGAGVPVVAILVAILVATLIPGAIARMRTERRDLRHERDRTHQIALLQTTTNLLGGSRHIRNCGQPVTDVGYVSALAWLYHTNVGFVGGLQQHVEAVELRKPLPKVLFKPLPRGGWSVLPWHTRPYQIPRCRGLNAEYVPGAGGARLIHLHHITVP